MIYDTLGNTEIKVSKICLGTMTWGEQNTEQEGFQQLDYAVANDVNFIDTAEIYAVPPKEETYGATETIIGNWLSKTKKRSELVLASKISGPNVPWIRDGAGFSAQQIEHAIDGSLRRLQTDYIDLIQLHWPQRIVQLWGQQNYRTDMQEEGADSQLIEYYQALCEIQKKGKFRHVGLSNETAWGVMKYQQCADSHQLPSVVSIQNAYSLVRREYEIALSEVSLYENIGLLAYSPLAGGLLSGKYAHDTMPEGSRFQLFPQMMGYYKNERSTKAIQAYQQLADELGVSLTQFSLAFVNQQPFVTSNIIGATSMPQLKENISSIEVQLNEQTLEKINEIFTEYPNPGNW